MTHPRSSPRSSRRWKMKNLLSDRAKYTRKNSRGRYHFKKDRNVSLGQSPKSFSLACISRNDFPFFSCFLFEKSKEFIICLSIFRNGMKSDFQSTIIHLSDIFSFLRSWDNFNRKCVLISWDLHLREKNFWI